MRPRVPPTFPWCAWLWQMPCFFCFPPSPFTCVCASVHVSTVLTPGRGTPGGLPPPFALVRFPATRRSTAIDSPCRSFVFCVFRPRPLAVPTRFAFPPGPHLLLSRWFYFIGRLMRFTPRALPPPGIPLIRLAMPGPDLGDSAHGREGVGGRDSLRSSTPYVRLPCSGAGS